jgi:hypothetical protein
MRAFLVRLEFLGGDCWSNGLGPFIPLHLKNLKPTINARESMLNSVPGIEEDLNRLKRWTSCTPLEKPVRGGR